MMYCALITLVYVSNLNLLSGVQAFSDQHQTSSKYLIGVHPDRRNFYELNSDQRFKCIDGSRTIPLEFVNDDYCDCLDASDEPGTSGCAHGQFFCQNEGYLQKLIPSAWVNDGQCDCCDASDEYNSSATCENTCGILGEIYRQEQERHREISDKGSAIRRQYKEQARLKREQNTQLLEQYRRELNERENAIKKIEEEMNSDFGPSQVFFPLKGQCYSYKDREYTYTLCPFERTTQESISGMQTELGRWAGWAGPSDDPYSRQKYEGGIQCWNGPSRSAVVNIACGVEDKVTSVTEPAKCEYVFDFITPAACPDPDPPEPQQPEQQQVPSSEDDRTSTESEQAEAEDEQINPESDEGAPDTSETHDEL